MQGLKNRKKLKAKKRELEGEIAHVRSLIMIARGSIDYQRGRKEVLHDYTLLFLLYELFVTRRIFVISLTCY